MAVRTICGNCKKSFSAQEEYLGKKVDCPRCGKKTAVLDEEALAAAKREEADKEKWKEEQEGRIALLERLSRRENRSIASEFGVTLDRVRNFHPGAVTRFIKLRALSRFMLLGAWLLFPLALVGAILLIQLIRAGGTMLEKLATLHPDGLSSILLQHEVVMLANVLVGVGCFTLFVFIFFLFKFLGEMAWLLADLGDHQLDVRNILLDLREDVDRYLEGPPQAS